MQFTLEYQLEEDGRWLAEVIDKRWTTGLAAAVSSSSEKRGSVDPSPCVRGAPR